MKGYIPPRPRPKPRKTKAERKIEQARNALQILIDRIDRSKGHKEQLINIKKILE